MRWKVSPSKKPFFASPANAAVALGESFTSSLNANCPQLVSTVTV
jgi:hypothetical protein